MRWRKTVNIKYILLDDDIEDAEKLKRIADVLGKSGVFPARLVKEVRRWSGKNYDEDYANAALKKVYDYAADNAIWSGP